MARQYEKFDFIRELSVRRGNVVTICKAVAYSAIFVAFFLSPAALAESSLALAISIFFFFL